ncbi:MAG: hypothetical protein Q4615_04390 [Paracoccus aminovorans]|nr:hypothetical protein [Paracoccus aminovorans]
MSEPTLISNIERALGICRQIIAAHDAMIDQARRVRTVPKIMLISKLEAFGADMQHLDAELCEVLRKLEARL